MRNKVLIGLTTAVSMAAITSPALAQSATNPADSPQIHIDNCVVKKSAKGYAYATCTLTAINMGKQTVYVSYKSNTKTFEPLTGGEFGSQSGTLGIPGAVHPGEVMQTYPMRFAFKDKTVAQLRKSLKVTISNPTGGAIITDGTATAQ